MQTLNAENITKTYGEKTLFKDLTFTINEHDRIGLIGTNGTGKTSLLNAITNLDPADSGSIDVPKDYRIAYLRQLPELDTQLTIRQAIFSGSQPIFKTIRHYEEILDQYSLNPDSSDLLDQFTKAEAAMNEQDAWNVESDIKTILTQLHINDLTPKISELSGGQVKRVALAQVLIETPDLLILDEPTNHLDFDSIEWLEEYLASYKGALLLVTHDRYFLDRITNHILELSFGDLFEYEGNYQTYVEQKATRIEQDNASKQKENKLYKQELEWMHRGPKGRGTKQQARINRFNDLSKNVKKPEQIEGNVQIDLGQHRLGKKVIEFKDVSLQVGNHQILNDFSELIQADERIGITGINGAGKSSFLNAIAGKIPLEAGTIDIGETVHLGYYTQQTEPIPEDMRMINYLTEIGEEVVNNRGERVSVTNLLEQFLFPRFMHGTLIRKLSGGEKRRLFLIRILMEQPNVLLLDEPTNDLDIATLTVLEDYLSTFNGTVITVSHDRYFLDKVGRRLLIFNGEGSIERYQGQLSDYLSEQKVSKGKAKENSVSSVESKNTVVKKERPKKRTYTEQQEWATIESEIDKLEQQVDSLQNEMNNQTDDYGKLADLQKQLDDANTELDQKMERWDYLASFEQ